ncbi:MAG: adenylate/guanylate cyclase domain-containing protein [Flavobacteriales bacterium]
MVTNSNLPILSSDEINKIDEFRKAKQTAVLAILFSDIENSTYATEKLGEQSYSKLRHIHDELFIRIMTMNNSGKIIKEIGDSFLCVFSEPSTAVLRAIEFQNAIHANKENLTLDDFTLKVKIGIHIGQVALENNFALDIFGRHVNRASRIQSIANGGQILTSQSIWENAVGWLKSHAEKNINWISYGKVKLKGIKESVDIYCFYSADTGKPSSPAVIKKKKLKSRTILFVVVILILTASFFSLQKLKQMKQDASVGLHLQLKKSYYVQFDFSHLTMYGRTSKLDTILLKEDLLSQIISVLYPDSIVEEVDFKESLSRKGIFYSSHLKDNSLDGKYFKDTLNYTGTIFIQPFKHITGNDTMRFKDSFGVRMEVRHGDEINDSILIRMRVELYTDSSSKHVDGLYQESMKNIRTDFRSDLNDVFMSMRADIIQGYVSNCSDSFFFFTLNKDAYLRKGSQIRLSRSYTGKEGLNYWLSDEKNKIEYFKDKPQYVEDLNYAISSYDHIKNDLSASLLTGNSSYGHDIGIRGYVVELYGTTGKAKWKIKGNYLQEKPRAGDRIYLSH